VGSQKDYAISAKASAFIPAPSLVKGSARARAARAPRLHCRLSLGDAVERQLRPDQGQRLLGLAEIDRGRQLIEGAILKPSRFVCGHETKWY
jgi:hypothetical protein